MSKAADGFLFMCDPNKNTACNKSGCFINGGPCNKTRHMKFAKDPSKVILVIPTDAKTIDKEDSDDNK